MRSRTLFVLAAAAALAACSDDATAPPREAMPRPSLVTENGCPGGGFTLEPPLDPATDENDDGVVCVLTFQVGSDGRTLYLERDNKT